MNSVWNRRSVWIFFAIGFGLPWLGWTINAFTGTQAPLRTVLFYMGDFMSVAGLVATWFAGGGPAVRALVRRLFRGAGIGWWLFALFLPLVWQLLARIAFGVPHGGLGGFRWQGLLGYFTLGTLQAATTGPIGEEFGWRGFLLPRLLTRYRPLVASLILGLIWGFWHYALYIHSVFASWQSAFDFMASVLCFTVLMTILFQRTRGSVGLAMVIHWTVNITPGVADAMIPGGHGIPENALRVFQLGSLVLITLIVGTLAGWRRLGAPADYDVVRVLPDEAIDADKPRS